ncbi:bifunctional RNase H/acid phosphatase [Spirilliplanes yamanashiensis]|uniref:Bifunctional RNase H/acid phosphatase n=1 Tax=Spirilliplanes yamanashiensis TaxID=42233 RepID=A0A8J3YEA8_9ACTN|nr:bifunctional RNase H/acid phosphatase [Spirilliplanes yamanashiensis]MDP9816679.1 putative phosphoglycerate mutase [Spirilliplanes yamanashiensis]GIJ06202.1 bifunctional RNase H/acid phosphatase [Spirilliplanes yamanashiensis]
MTIGKVIVEADGGSRGNPGPAGYGAVVIEPATGVVLAERFDALGVATNNVAEYTGLIAGLEAALALGASAVEVRMDSKLVVEQMAGRWQIKHPGLRPLAAQAAQLVRKFDSVTYEWIPRARNTKADALANKAMDAAAGRPGKASVAEPPREVAAADSPARAAAREAAARATEKKQPVQSWAPRDTAGATRLVLVRHGETELTAQGRYSGRGDVPLSQTGEAQAMAAAARVAALAGPVAAVVSSPLRRCTRTAQLIAAEVGAEVVTDPGFIECDFGAWEGLTFADVRQRWPEELTAWLGSTALAPPGGESFQAVAKRVRAALAGVREAYPGQSVVLVSHVSPLKILLRDALAAGDGFLHRMYLDPAGVSLLDMWPDGGVAVRAVNETAHLR